MSNSTKHAMQSLSNRNLRKPANLAAALLSDLEAPNAPKCRGCGATANAHNFLTGHLFVK